MTSQTLQWYQRAARQGSEFVLTSRTDLSLFPYSRSLSLSLPLSFFSPQTDSRADWGPRLAGVCSQKATEIQYWEWIAMSCCQCSNLGNRQNSYFSRLLGHWGGRIIPKAEGHQDVNRYLKHKLGKESMDTCFHRRADSSWATVQRCFKKKEKKRQIYHYTSSLWLTYILKESRRH